MNTAAVAMPRDLSEWKKVKETDEGEVPFLLRYVLERKQGIRAKRQYKRGMRARTHGDGLVKGREPGNVLELIGTQEQLRWRDFALNGVQRHRKFGRCLCGRLHAQRRSVCGYANVGMRACKFPGSAIESNGLKDRMRMKRGVQIRLGDEMRFKRRQLIDTRSSFVGDLNGKLFVFMLNGNGIILAYALGHAIHLFGVHRNVRRRLRGRR